MKVYYEAPYIKATLTSVDGDAFSINNKEFNNKR